MGLSQEQFFHWSRYGIEPYNWVIGSRLMASVYPKELDYLHYLRINENISRSINLAESPWPDGWSRDSSIECYHFPIIDMSVPSEHQVLRIIEIIDQDEAPVMVHCAAGIGRTGTLMALYLVAHGMDSNEAISMVREKRKGSIQTSAQERMIHDWYRKKVVFDGL